jgi:D-arabinose 1-dehydrogenase-like Zn-dependent alcohol dehydrogenase
MRRRHCLQRYSQNEHRARRHHRDLAVQYARKLGYRTVALSTSSNKKDFAEQLGATDYIDTSKENAAEALQKMGGASLIVVTAPNPEVMGPLVNGLGPLGKLLILARE